MSFGRSGPGGERHRRPKPEFRAGSPRQKSDICSSSSKRPDLLSITHKLHSDHDAQLYVGEPRHASPDHGVSRWRIVCASEIAT